MKKSRLKRLAKTAEKQIQDQISLNLIVKATELTGNVQDKKLKKLIAKSANKLGKKIAKKLNFDVTLPDMTKPFNTEIHQETGVGVAGSKTFAPASSYQLDEQPPSRRVKSVQTNKAAASLKRDTEPPVGIS